MGDNLYKPAGRFVRATALCSLVMLVSLLSACNSGDGREREESVVESPDGQLQVVFTLDGGSPYYRVTYRGSDIIVRSALGLEFDNISPLDRQLTILDVRREEADTEWALPWGEVETVRDHHNELRVELEQTVAPRRRMAVVFKVYNDGVGFRYELPHQEHLGRFELTGEKTEFALPADHPAWWIPAYKPQHYEYLYTHSPISRARDSAEAVHTPLTLQAGELYISIHEAALTDYAAMTLVPGADNVLRCDLVPWSDGVKVRGTTPHRSPWRTIQVAQAPGGLIESRLILNLNEPSKIEDTSWIEPRKYAGIWWGMHIGEYTWSPGPDHGATTANTERYIDFAADNGIAGVLVEGWNKGWETFQRSENHQFDFTTPFDDFDLPALADYARARGVRIIGHHETGGDVANYERQLEEAFQYYRRLGIDSVKTGYVSRRIRRYESGSRPAEMEWHHGQYMVRHYRRVVEAAARYGITLNVHEPIKDTGIRRTYPNMMTREGVRGQEYNAWDSNGGNPPDHTTVLPFTRMLAGPLDFTPGIFDLLLDPHRPDNRVNTTLAKQLALYVVLYSPLQMVADLPENYTHPAFDFIVDVPTDWQATEVLNGRIGEYVTIARKQRGADDWYIGSITNEQGRSFDIDLLFLDPHRTYTARIYADGQDAHWESAPLAVDVVDRRVTRNDKLAVTLAPGGGQAIRIQPDTP